MKKEFANVIIYVSQLADGKSNLIKCPVNSYATDDLVFVSFTFL